MKKLILKASFILLGLLVCIYSVLAGYLWWSEKKTPTHFLPNSFLVNSKEPHNFILINSGLESLKRRIQAINEAQNTIELEYFIYELDLAAQIISSRLIEAAKRGVKVKILVDTSAPVFKLTPEYAKFLQTQNISVKYYNTVPLTSFIEVQHRSHRKLLIVDGVKLITGGRNIGNEYFDLSEHYNFLDSDVEISGPIVQDVQKSFLTYWTSEYANIPEVVIGKVKLDFVEEKKINIVLKWLKQKKFNTKVYTCNDIDFITDSPGVEFQNRKIWPYLLQKLTSVSTSIDVESPYFVLRSDGLKLMQNLSKRKVSQTYLTNSLYSTDAYYTVSAIIPTLVSLEKLDAKIFLYNGESANSEDFPLTDFSQSKRWGLHSKRAVLDNKHTLIGTYNIDPRSANLNSEVLISCNNNEQIAEATLKNMLQRRSHAWRLFQKDTGQLSALTHKASFSQKVKFILIMPLASLFNFLL